MKKKLAIVGAVALAAVIGVTASGCSNSTRNLASLASNWYLNADFDKIQPTFVGEENAEKLTYAVKQTEESKNSDYSVTYSAGTYTTEFYAKEMTADALAQITREEWLEGYTKKLSSKGVMYLYYYKTELTLPSATYKCGDDEEHFGEQKVLTESYFMPVEYYLRPVYSYREVKRAIPASLNASSVEECYIDVDMTYESFYNFSGNNVYTVIGGTSTTGGKQKDESNPSYSVGSLNGYDNSVFDVSYLDIVARAMKHLSSSFTQLVNVYTPGLQPFEYIIAGGNSALLPDEKKSAEQLAQIQAVLEAKGLFTPEQIDENDPEKGMTALTTASVNVIYNVERYSGVSQRYWFAIGDSARALMIKYSEPLAYNCGTLEYVLTDIDHIS